MTTPAGFIARARRLVGTPFHHQGRNRHGLDCVGLVELALEAEGALPEDYRTPRDYGPRPGPVLRLHLERWCRPAPGPAPAVLIEVRWPRAAHSAHVAILTDDGTVIHAVRQGGDGPGVVEQAYRGALRRLTVGHWFLPGVRYE